jgi:hypothetical protein
MLFKQVMIAKDPILEAMDSGDWCATYRAAARYYLRNREYVTVEQVYEDFENDNHYETREVECERCGAMSEEEVESDNPSVTIEELTRLFRDLGDPTTADWIQACEDCGLDWYEQPVTDIWLRDHDWTYKKLFSVWRYGQGFSRERFETEEQCRQWIENMVAPGYTYLIRYLDDEDTQIEVKKEEPKRWLTYVSGYRGEHLQWDDETSARRHLIDCAPSGYAYVIESPEGVCQLLTTPITESVNEQQA